MNRMKLHNHFFIILTVFGLSFGLSSCENDVDLFGDIEESPVVYGLLSSSDTAQYIRLERSFADPLVGAVTLAKDENSVYFMDASVDLINAATSERFSLASVNAVDEGYVRQEGDFLTDPNYLYKIASDQIDLSPEVIYNLEVKKGENIIATSSTQVLDNSKFRSPAISQGVARIAFENKKFTTIRWSRVDNASSYAISFDFVIRENDIMSGDKETIELRWDATSLLNDKGGTNTSQDVDLAGQSFFDFLDAQFDPEANITRQLLKLDIRVTTFGAEIGQYLDVINANSGITSAQEVPSFTNIEGGYGLFSSTNKVVLEDLSLTPKTLDSLYNGSTTADLQFTP